MVPFTITKMGGEHAISGWHCSQIVSNDLFYGEIKMLPSKLLHIVHHVLF